MLPSPEFHITIQRYINNFSNLARKRVRIFVRGHCVFQDAKTETFEGQAMSKGKYLHVFSRKIEAIVFIILQIFCNARGKCL